MKVNWKYALATKLFLLMTISLLFTVGTTVYQNRNMFKDFLERQLEDTTIRKSQETATSIESILENWVSTTSVAMSNIPNKSSEGFEIFLNNFLVANAEFIAFDVYSSIGNEYKSIAKSFTENTNDIRFEEREKTELRNKLYTENKTWLANILKQKNLRSQYIKNHNRNLAAPVTSIAIRYAIENQESYNWAIISIWQTRLMKTLPHNANQTSFIIDSKKTSVSLSPMASSEWDQIFADNLPIIEAAKNHSPFGFKAFQGGEDASFISAYQKLEKYGLTVAIINNAKSAYMIIQNILLKSVLWAVVYLVFFVGVSFFASSTITKSLSKLTLATHKIASGNFEVQLNTNSKDEVGLLSRSVNNMSDQIRELLISKVEQARQEKELETAKLIQDTLFPTGKIIESNLLKIAAKNKPASECGGDWWYHHTANDGREFIVIADATGHGASAALVTAMAFSGYQMLLQSINDSSETLEPLKLLNKLNSVFYKAGNGTSTMTSLICVFDPKTGLLTLANAGHNLPFIIPRDAEDTRLISKFAKKRKKRIVSIQASGSPLGITDKWEGEEVTYAIEPGDKILLYTDGIFECSNFEGEQWGSRRFRKNLGKNASENVEPFLDKLFDEATQFFAGNPADDDITVVVAEISENWQSKNRVA